MKMQNWLIFFLFFSCISTTVFGSHPVERFVYGPSNNDPRVVGLTIAGTVGILFGLYIIKKGFDTFTNEAQISEKASAGRYIIDKFSNLCSRVLGLGVATCGGMITFGSGLLIVSNKELITRFESEVTNHS